MSHGQMLRSHIRDIACFSQKTVSSFHAQPLALDGSKICQCYLINVKYKTFHFRINRNPRPIPKRRLILNLTPVFFNFCALIFVAQSCVLVNFYVYVKLLFLFIFLTRQIVNLVIDEYFTLKCYLHHLLTIKHSILRINCILIEIPDRIGSPGIVLSTGHLTQLRNPLIWVVQWVICLATLANFGLVLTVIRVPVLDFQIPILLSQSVFSPLKSNKLLFCLFFSFLFLGLGLQFCLPFNLRSLSL